MWLLLSCFSSDPPSPREGEFTVLTYNVAGLPAGLSDADPAVTMPQIGPRLNDFELVLVQEDFTFHDALVQGVTHPYQSEPKEPEALPVGDGLNRFSTTSFEPLTRVQWGDCWGGFDYGSGDCLAEKGFSWAVHDVGGAGIVVVNHHAEAGGNPEDVEARWGNVEQLLVAVDAFDPSLPIVIGGDTNMAVEDTEDLPQLEAFAEAGFVDACEVATCDPEAIDWFLLRSSPSVRILALDHWEPEGFVDSEGEPLSDHEPVAARLRWERLD